MSASKKNLPEAVGFLSIMQHRTTGLMGGLLLLNPMGRPLEFHCTAPVKPNRAQEILYGPTLEPFLYGEQIGQSLVRKSSVLPRLILTDVEPAVSIRTFVDRPVVWIEIPAEDADEPSLTSSAAAAETWGGRRTRIDAPHLDRSRGTPTLSRTFELAGRQAAVDPAFPDDQQQVETCWGGFADHIDPVEPFQRIREAIREAQGGTRT